MNSYPFKTRPDGYIISKDKKDIDLQKLHNYLSKESYWSKNIPYKIVQKSTQHSQTYSILLNNEFVGFARVITDFSTFGYLADVYIDQQHRKKGLGKWLIESIMTDSDFSGFRNWVLFTKDAHSLYEKFGWKRVTEKDLIDKIMLKKISPEQLYK